MWVFGIIKAHIVGARDRERSSWHCVEPLVKAQLEASQEALPLDFMTLSQIYGFGLTSWVTAMRSKQQSLLFKKDLGHGYSMSDMNSIEEDPAS